MKRIIVITGIIMLLIMPITIAKPMTWLGNVTYPNETRVSDGWDIYLTNDDEYYGTEPWHDETDPFGWYNAHCAGQSEGTHNHITVNVTSPDGQWFGEIAHVLLSDIQLTGDAFEKDITVYKQSVLFTKDLVPGWNLISLPQTPDDNSVSAVLLSIEGKYDAVMKYTPENGFEDIDTMDPGYGYFIYMNKAGTWSYDGSAFETISIGLSPGLNLVGWVNSDVSLSDALSSIEGNYNYVACWNAAEMKYEVFYPSAPVGFNDFDLMEKAEGYFISITTGCTLEYS